MKFNAQKGFADIMTAKQVKAILKFNYINVAFENWDVFANEKKEDANIFYLDANNNVVAFWDKKTHIFYI